MPSDFCYECNHPQRFHFNLWNGYRGLPKRTTPCWADEGECGCPEFTPEPVEVKGRNENLESFSDNELIQELRYRRVLGTAKKTVSYPSGLEVWEKYSTGWLTVDEVFVGSE